ncbi:glutamic acid-rich protein-like [Ruditapes philippinarum]|uniref:glutamic acid-rich protein-like n=1 Tax=Ruditapes philippinarum TaxID=129788 RepID=UPI00295B3A3B|nr:glutamic acid-rich protein-like [Ruditapes philippinarum]
MDSLAKREKEKEKKRRQRQKLRLNEEKHKEAKSKDAARKKQEIIMLKENAALHSRKYKHVINKIRQGTANRVQTHRQKNKEQRESIPVTPNFQQKRRQKEKHCKDVQNHRKHEQMKKQANRERVAKYRLRMKLRTPQVPVQSPQTPNNEFSKTLNSGYKHRSSAQRAFMRVNNLIPSTPAKKVCIIEKLVSSTTPRSRKALCESETVQTIMNSNMSRKKLSAQFALTESLKDDLSQNKHRTSTSIVAMKLLLTARKVSSVSDMLKISRKRLAKSIHRENVQRKSRSDKISDENKEIVHNFYLEEASRDAE